MCLHLGGDLMPTEDELEERITDYIEQEQKETQNKRKGEKE